MIEILRVIGARLAGDPKVGTKEGCTKQISNSLYAALQTLSLHPRVLLLLIPCPLNDYGE
jgi:hypothetical protein